MAAPLQAEVNALDKVVVDALERRDYSSLKMMGNGELTVVLGWPAMAPTWVCKPAGPFNAEEFVRYQYMIEAYTAALRERGVAVVDTSIVGVERERGLIAGYMVQPVQPRATLAEVVLQTAAPDAEHPLLVSIAGALGAMDSNVALDAPATNWCWDGTDVHMLDVGLPLMWEGSGFALETLIPLFRALPAPARPLAMREIGKLLERYRDPRIAAVECAGRMRSFPGLEGWRDPAIECFNHRLELAEPITIAETEELNAGDDKEIPRWKKMQRFQRAWTRVVRRRRYDWFVVPSTYGLTR